LIVPLLLSSFAFATPQCSFSTGATLNFGSIPALASTGDVVSDTGTSLWLNCSSDVASPPSIYSSTPRVMTSGSRGIPFRLSLSGPGASDVPTSSPGAQLGILRDGINHPIALFGKILAGDFRGLPSGTYGAPIVLTIEY
jgi:spore coat protein U-like protein